MVKEKKKETNKGGDDGRFHINCKRRSWLLQRWESSNDVEQRSGQMGECFMLNPWKGWMPFWMKTKKLCMLTFNGGHIGHKPTQGRVPHLYQISAKI